MKIPESWLRHFCSPDWTSEVLAERLTMAGLEVEERVPFAPAFSGIVVGEILSVEPHPNADKLRVCQVAAGGAAPFEIVCGAPNAAAGLRVPCALPGAQLPGGLNIAPVTMRGVTSNGMLCSARELGLSEDHSGLMALDANLRVGVDIRDALQLDEPVLTLKLTPNLAHCLSIHGVAREVSALSGAPLRMPAFEPVPVTTDQRLPVRIEAPDLCGRFSGRVIRGVNARARTPGWMADRLIRAGQRPISALVDISNYVMLEMGRPSHVFDLNRIHGSLAVRWAEEGETLELLNGQTVTLDASFGVIADDKALESLAGIMGGNATAVDDDTTDIYLEAAFWWPAAIAGRARRLNFSTDASYRFERGVDPATIGEHIEYLSRLILDVCGGQAGPVDDQIAALPETRHASLRFDRARKVIGQPLSDEQIVAALARLALPLERQRDGVLVTVPSYRFDIALEEDLIEEVARMHGFDNLPVRAPIAPAAMLLAPDTRRSLIEVKRALAARDYQEIISYSFVGAEDDRSLTGIEPVRLLNPIAQTMDVMRTSLWSGLLGALRANLNRKAQRVRLFESGRVFLLNPDEAGGPLTVKGLDQPERLAAIAYGMANDEQWGESARPVDFHDLKQDLQALVPEGRFGFVAAEHPALHPGRSARIVDGSAKPVGWIGELHPALQRARDLHGRVQLFELDVAPMLIRAPVLFEPVSRFPPSIRDIALVVDARIPAADIHSKIREIVLIKPGLKLIKNVRLFDEYRGKGLENKEKSLAFRLWMQDTERTLEDGEVADAVAVIVQELERSFAARLR